LAVATTDVAQSTNAQAFLSAYDSTYGAANLGAYSAAGYDIGNMVIQAIKTALAGGAKPPTSSGDSATAKTFRQAVINAIQNIQFTGVLGPQSFDANGDTTNRVITIYQVGPPPANLPVSTPGWNPVAAVKIGS
jgi:branched-chain amino acid transport system substrate-binding protein